MPGETFAQSLPVAGMEGLERGGRERRFSLGAGLPDRLAGVAETIARACRPGLIVERNEGFEFAQVVSVAERMGPRSAVQIAIGLETVIDDAAAFEAFRHRATLGAGAVKCEGFGGRRMQPLRLAADSQARLVEAAHARRG